MKKFKLQASQVFLGLALAQLAVALVLSLQTYSRMAAGALAFHYPLDYGEGPLLDQALRLAAGEKIYRSDFSLPPYTVSNYPPVFPLLQAPFSMLFGPAFWYGRLTSVLSALATALLIGLTLYTLTGEKVAAPIAGLLFLTFPHAQYWSTLNRVDLLALALSWAALYVVARKPGARRGIPLAAALLVLSAFTRQSYAFAAPFSAFVFLSIERKWRDAIRLALITGGGGLILFLLVNLATRGGFFLNIVTANANPFYWDSVRHHFGELADRSAALLAVVGIFLLAGQFRGRGRSWPLALAYLAAAAASGITIGKDGANVNYFLELAAALSFAAGAALAWVGKRPWLQVVVAAALCIQVAGFARWVQEDHSHRVLDRIAQEEDVAALYHIVQETDGIVLADEFMGLLPIAGKRLYFQPFEFKMLAEGGLWDEQAFLASLAGQEFDFILWYDPATWDSIEARWTPRQREMIEEYYKKARFLADTRVLTREEKEE